MAVGWRDRTGNRVRETLTVSPVRRAALKLQGQDMGLLRGLGAKQTAQVKAVRATNGVEAAIGVARTMGIRT